MTSTTSSLSGPAQFGRTYAWALRKNAGMTALIALLLFLANPLVLLVSLPGWISENAAREVMSQADRMRAVETAYTNFVTKIAPMLALAVLLLFCLVLCVGLFGYMQKKRSVDLFHALPVGRVPMLTGRWCAGMTALLLPLLADYAAMGIVGAAYGVSVTQGARSPLAQMLWMLLMCAAAFTFCMFMAVCTGTTLDAMLSILGVNGGYPLLILCVYTVAGMLLPGFAAEPAEHLAVLTAFAPFAAAFPAVFQQHTVWFLLWWILLTAALLIGSVLLYRRRRSETAEDNFAFPIPKILIRLILTAVGGLGFGLILSSMRGTGFLVGVIAGSLATHLIVEAVYSRGFQRLKKSFAWYGVFAVLFVVFYGALCTGLFGYDMRVPDPSQVESVSIDPNSSWTGNGSQIIYDENYRRLAVLAPTIREQGNIRTVVGAQRSVIAEFRARYPYRLKTIRGRGLSLFYRMKDGRTFSRTYRQYSADMDLEKTLDPFYGKLSGMREYAETRDLIFYVAPEDLARITMNQKNGDRSLPLDGAVAKRLQQALQQDFLDGKVNARVTKEVSVSLAGEVVGAASGPALEDLTVQLEFRQNLTAKTDRMKALLGGYRGRFNIQSGPYQLTDRSAATWKLLEELKYV